MLNTISLLREKKGEDYINNFLNEKIIITEKLDTYRVLFEKINNKLVFFKKDNTEINLVERILTNIWEDAIIEISTIVGDTKLPENIRFGVAYTPNEKPIRLSYTKIPKYILTDITLRKDNKVVEIYEYDEVEKWAALLNMGKPPIIFEGILSDEQKKKIIEYDNREFDNIENNFTELIESLFEKTYSNENVIEGIVIKNKKDLIQLISYEFELLNESYEKTEFSRDYYDLLLININNFMDRYNFPILEGTTTDEMYVEIISDIFNKFCQKNPNLIENINPQYLTPPSFGYFGNLNLLLIKNKETLQILEYGGKIYESLFKIILSSFRKPKKETGLLNESIINKFNTYVYLIKNIIKEEIVVNEYIDEYIDKINPVKKDNNIVSINEINSANIVVDALNKRKNTDVDNMRVIASVQKAFEPAKLKVKQGDQKCAIYLTECKPFTNKQLENIEALNKMWKCPVIITSVSNERKIEGKDFNFSDKLTKAQLKILAEFYTELIPAYFILDNWNIKEIFEYCRPKYEPIVIITDIGKKADLVIQLYFEDEVMGGRINVEQNMNIGEIENLDQLPAIRSIEDNNANAFKQLTPQPIWNFFDNMISEYKLWNGEILYNKFTPNNFI